MPRMGCATHGGMSGRKSTGGGFARALRRSIAVSGALLKLLPRRRSEVIVAGQRVSINRGSHVRAGMAEALAHVRKGNARGQQLRAVGMAERMKAGSLGQIEIAEQQRDGRRYGVRLQRRAVRITE